MPFPIVRVALAGLHLSLLNLDLGQQWDMHVLTQSTQQVVLQQQWVIEEEWEMLSLTLQKKVPHHLFFPIVY
jgi:hypothetical protein